MLPIVLQLYNSMSQKYCLTIWAFITSFTIVIIAITVFYLTLLMYKKLSSVVRSKTIPPTIQVIPGLSQSNLSQIISSADTTVQSTISPHNGNLYLYINNTAVSFKTIKYLIKCYKTIVDNQEHNPLLTTHVSYLEGSIAHCNSYFCEIDRAILGVSLDNTFGLYTGGQEPNIHIIHHMINYMYTTSYINALSNIINNILNDPSRYRLINTAARPDIIISYNTLKPDQFSLNVIFERSLKTIEKKPRIYPIIAGIRFIISLPQDISEPAQYSRGKIFLNFSNIPYRVMSRAVYRPAICNISKEDIEIIYDLPDFTTQHTSSIEQISEDMLITHNTTNTPSLENSTRQR
ncbi:hypothetical protein FDZ58_01260 [Ehrlichia ruminantium]|nr:hypothetical protein AUR40_00995 [Ehrlichia ruminantium]QLK50303.1 hypothetical protein FDZ68_01260 [Ehrlichia ruminantium]QLK51227.1 hypothetical protein FDZ66_01265 [Ehrlichia ruminantium]QLK53062.1 hypothetical protein FDZ64_01260 [Ehrlichia ruminantium]QLK58564.1 hypothetical protein FDZ58_01260 [Ehrlichia ruminantium]